MSETMSFDSLYERFRPVVRRRLIALLVKYPNEVEDAFQNTFVKVWRSLEQAQPDNNVQVWVLRIATNTALDVLRARRLMRVQSLDATREDENGETVSVYDQLVDPVDWFALSEEYASLKSSLNRLPAQHRQALLLVGAGYSYADIASRLAVRPDACKTLIGRARQALRAAQQKTSPSSVAAMG